VALLFPQTALSEHRAHYTPTLVGNNSTSQVVTTNLSFHQTIAHLSNVSVNTTQSHTEEYVVFDSVDDTTPLYTQEVYFSLGDKTMFNDTFQVHITKENTTLHLAIMPLVDSLLFSANYTAHDEPLVGLQTFCTLRENATGNWSRAQNLIYANNTRVYEHALPLADTFWFQLHCQTSQPHQTISLIDTYYSPAFVEEPTPQSTDELPRIIDLEEYLPSSNTSATNTSSTQPYINTSELNTSEQIIIEDLYGTLLTTNNTTALYSASNQNEHATLSLLVLQETKETSVFTARYVDSESQEPLSGLQTACTLRENSQGTWSSPQQLWYNATSQTYTLYLQPSQETFLFELSCQAPAPYEPIAIIDTLTMQEESLALDEPVFFEESYEEYAGINTPTQLHYQHEQGLFTATTSQGELTQFGVSFDAELTFTITNVTPEPFTVEINLPFALPEGLHFYLWKTLSTGNILVPYDISSDRTTLHLTLQDGVIDNDETINGIVVDPLQLTLPTYEFSVQTTPDNKQATVFVDDRELVVTTPTGVLDTVALVDPLNLPDLPGTPNSFTHKLVRFTADTLGEEALDVYLTYDDLPSTFSLWKFNSNTQEWYTFPYDRVDEQTLRITLVDGGFGDDDGLVNGKIVDDIGIVAGDTSLHISDVSDNETVYHTQNNTFYANYTNRTSNESIIGLDVYCEFTENSTGSWSAPVNMTYNATSELYAFTQNYSEGTFTFNVSCYNEQGYENITLSDAATITIALLPPFIAFAPPTYPNSTVISTLWTLINVTTDDVTLSGFIDLNNQLLGYWNFENVSETIIYDSSTYKMNASLINDAFVVENDLNKIRGNFVSLDGVNRYVEIPSNTLLDITTAFTLEAWIKRGTPTSSWSSIINRNGDDTFNLQHNQYNTAFEFAVRTDIGRTHISGEPSGGLEENVWYHVVGVFGNGQLRLYVNGEQIASGTRSGVIQPANSELVIGARRTSASLRDRYFNGSIDEVKFWNRSLSAEEINNSYELQKDYFYRNTTFLPEGSNTFSACVIDISGNQNCTSKRHIILDTIFPNINFTSLTPRNNSYINTSWIEISVAVLEENLNKTVLLWNGSEELMSCENESSLYTCFVNITSLSTGTYTYHVFAEDEANQTAYTKTRTIFVDLDHPSALLFHPQNNSAFTETNSIAFNYSVSDNYFIDSCWYGLQREDCCSDYGLTMLPNCENITLPLLPNGQFSLTLFVNDTAGNIFNKTHNFDVNLTTIEIIPFYPLNMTHHNSSTITTRFIINREVDFCNVTLNDSESYLMQNSSSLDWFAELTSLAEGTHALSYYCEDDSGYFGNTNLSLIIDTISPSSLLVNPASEFYYSENDVLLEYVAIDESSFNCSYSLNDDSFIHLPLCENTTMYDLADDYYNLTLRVIDAAHNVNITSLQFTVDTQPPVITLQSPLSNAYSYSALPLNITLNEPAQSCTYSLNAGENISLYEQSPQEFNTSSVFSEGNHLLDFYCTDFANNVGTKQHSFIIDTLQPSIAFSPPTKQHLAKLSHSWMLINTTTQDEQNYSVFTDFNKQLLLYTNFENVSGTIINDASSYENQAQLRNGQFNPQTQKIRGDYLSLNGINQDVVIPFNETFNLVQNYSVEAWIRHDGVQTSSWASIINRNGNAGFRLHHNSLNTRFEFAVGTSDYVAGQPAEGIQIGRWYHLVGTYDGQHIKLYVDGEEQGVVSASSLTPTSSSPLYIGSFDGVSRWFNGSIDEVRIWNRVLTPNEIQSSFNAKTATLLVNYSELAMDNHTFVSCAIDISGNYNCTETRVVERIDDFLTLNQQLPQQNLTSVALINFTCSFASNSFLANASLYLTNKLNESFSFNDSVTLSGTNETATWLRNLSAGIYTWNCLGQDNETKVVWGENRTLFINEQANASYSLFDGETTDFNAHPTPETISGAIIELVGEGRIAWNGVVNASTQNFNEAINITANEIVVNASLLHPSFNTSTNLTFYNRTWVYPVIYRNGQLCATCNVLSYDGGELVFNVVGFSSYTSGEGTNLSIWDFTDTQVVFNDENNYYYANYTNITAGSAITGANVYCEFTENSTGSWSTPVNMTYDASERLYYYNKTMPWGVFAYNVSCFNDLGYANLTASDTANITRRPTKELFIQNITFSTQSPQQHHVVDIFVNITNTGNETAENFSLALNISLWNGTDLLSDEVLLKTNSTLLANTDTLLTFNWTAKPGTYIFDGFVDSDDVVTELDETNNTFTTNLTTSAWSISHGKLEQIIALGVDDNKVIAWNLTEKQGHVFYYDYDSSVDLANLEALGTGTNDFAEADAALGMTGFTDSISALFDSNTDDAADTTRDIVVLGDTISNVPVTFSTNASSPFVTGILWDASLGGEYDGSQPLVIVAIVASNTTGQYGTYDYEVRLPTLLQSWEGANDYFYRLVEFY